MNAHWISALTGAAAGLAAVPVVLRCARSYVPPPPALGRAAVALSSSALSGLAGWRFAGAPEWPAWCWLAVVGSGLALIDLSCHRLPRPWVAALAAGGLTVFTVAGTAGQQPALIRALAAFLVVFAAGASVQWLVPGQMGFGDTTLYSALALYQGWVGWHAVAAGITASILLLGAIAAIAWISGLRSWNCRIAAGPAVLAGSSIGVLT